MTNFDWLLLVSVGYWVLGLFYIALARRIQDYLTNKIDMLEQENALLRAHIRENTNEFIK